MPDQKKRHGAQSVTWDLPVSKPSTASNDNNAPTDPTPPLVINPASSPSPIPLALPNSTPSAQVKTQDPNAPTLPGSTQTSPPQPCRKRHTPIPFPILDPNLDIDAAALAFTDTAHESFAYSRPVRTQPSSAKAPAPRQQRSQRVTQPETQIRISHSNRGKRALPVLVANSGGVDWDWDQYPDQCQDQFPTQDTLVDADAEPGKKHTSNPEIEAEVEAVEDGERGGGDDDDGAETTTTNTHPDTTVTVTATNTHSDSGSDARGHYDFDSCTRS